MAEKSQRKNTLVNYTTEISVDATVKDIIGLLFDKGAERVSIDRHADNTPKAVRFSFPFPDLQKQFIDYRIEANWQGALDVMKKKSDVAPRYRNEAQAKRTTWRTILYWMQMQIGMAEMMQGQIEQMFFSHAIDGKTDKFVTRELLDYKKTQLLLGE